MKIPVLNGLLLIGFSLHMSVQSLLEEVLKILYGWYGNLQLHGFRRVQKLNVYS